MLYKTATHNVINRHVNFKTSPMINSVFKEVNVTTYNCQITSFSFDLIIVIIPSALADVTTFSGAIPKRDPRHNGPMVLIATAGGGAVHQLVEHLGDA